MPVNLDKPQNWKADIARSVDMYNDWFMEFAPKAFRETRIETTKSVEATLVATNNMRNIRPEILRKHPEVLSTLRMSTCPPIAVDRLIGLSRVSPNLVKTMEDDKRLPPRLLPRKQISNSEKSATLSRRWPIQIFLFGSHGRISSFSKKRTYRRPN